MLISGGPNIPEKLFRAQEENRLVLFCGAGISCGAGLPLFRELVDSICDKLKATKNELEKIAYYEKKYDQVLSQLEERFGAGQVRKALATRLRDHTGFFDHHHSILRLAKTGQQGYRLITTNFDNLFAEAGADEKFSSYGPRVPSASLYWNSLVHLHGSIADPTGQDHSNLVVTSKDFGRAYLLEGWASRFLVEVFRRYVVVFIGYSADDLVMRYLLDSLAAARGDGDHFELPYAFAPTPPDEAVKIHAEWKVKGVEPILYDPDKSHLSLYRSLEAWGSQYSDGFLSRIAVIQRDIEARPTSINDENVQRVVWALKDSSGKPASELSSIHPTPHFFDWLRILETAGLLSSSDAKGIGQGIANDLFWRPGGGFPDLDQVRLHLVTWLSRHLGSMDLLRWVIEKRSPLHPRLRWAIIAQLESNGNELRSELRKIWQLLTSDYVNSAIARGSPLVFPPNLGHQTAAMMGSLAKQLLAPVPRLGFWDSPWLADGGDKVRDEEGDDRRSVFRSIEVDVNLVSADFADDFEKYVKDNPQQAAVLGDIVSSQLREAVELFAMFDKADDNEDSSYSDIPSISEHPQNTDLHEWTKLVKLVRTTFDCLLQWNEIGALALAMRWHQIQYPVFRRLFIYAAGQMPGPLGQRFIDTVREKPGPWLWSVHVQREVLAFLREAGSRLTLTQLEVLAHVILVGPPRNLYKPMGDDKWEALNNREIWHRLAKLVSAGVSLPEGACVAFEELSKDQSFELPGNHADEFPVWTESGWGDPREERRRANILALEDASLVARLVEKSGEDADVVGSLIGSNPDRFLRVLERVREYCEVAVRVVAFAGFTAASAREYSHFQKIEAVVVSVLQECASPNTRDVVHGVVRWIAVIDEAYAKRDLEGFFELWEKYWSTSASLPKSTKKGAGEEAVMQAINHPAGVIVESLLSTLWIQERKHGGGLPDAFKERFEVILATEGYGGYLGRVILASRLSSLFEIDPDWAKMVLLPRMKWGSSPEVVGLWQGFLWSPRIEASLREAFKDDFLAAVAHSDEFDQNRGRVLRELFTVACAEAPSAFSDEEKRSTLRAVGASGLAAVGHTLRRMLVASGDKAQNMWLDRIKPFLQQYWPKEIDMKSSPSSQALAELAIECGKNFDEAVDVMLPLLAKIESHPRYLHKLMKEKLELARLNPERTLFLLSATIDESTQWRRGLKEVLDELVKAEPSLRNDPRFKKLLMLS